MRWKLAAAGLHPPVAAWAEHPHPQPARGSAAGLVDFAPEPTLRLFLLAGTPFGTWAVLPAPVSPQLPGLSTWRGGRERWHPSPTAIFFLHVVTAGLVDAAGIRGTRCGTIFRPMPKRKPALPPRVRAHGNGFRGVATILGRRAYGPTYPTVDGAIAWLESLERVGPEAGAPLTLNDGLDLLRRDLADTAAAQGTVDFYERSHLELATVLGGDTRLDALNEKAIRFYIDRRKRRGVALQTIVKKELGTLRRIIRLAMQSGRLGRDPMLGVKMPRVRGGRFDTIAAADVAAAIEKIRAANPDHADIVELVWRTSMRRAEVARLTVEDVDIPNRRLYVLGKAVDRYRPIGADLVPVLERMIARVGSGPLVSSIKKIENVFGRWRKKLGGGAFSPHVLRHGFASDLLNRGTPEPVVASLMGHQGTRMLARYFHAQDAALLAAVDELGKARPRPPRTPSGAIDSDRPEPRS